MTTELPRPSSGIYLVKFAWLLFAWLLLVVLTGCDTSSDSSSQQDLAPATNPNTPAVVTQSVDPVELNLDTAQTATVLVLGDSISAAYGIQREEGWVALLAQELRNLDETFTVANASISGETTAGGLARLDAALARHRPQVVVVELGGNDALRGYPVAQIEENLRNIIQRSQATDAKVVLVGMQIPPNYGARYSQGFSELFPNIAAETDSVLIDSLLEPIALQPDLMQSDGIHPTADAQPLLLNAIWPSVRQLLRSASS